MEDVKDNRVKGELVSKNEPYILTTYKNPGSLDEYVLIIMPIVSGAQNVRYELSEDGLIVNVKIEWPRTMCLDIEKLFKNEGGEKPLHKILAIEGELSLCRDNMKSTPITEISIRLPFAVQTSPAEHIIHGYEGADGCKVLRIELPAFKKLYSKTETIINFEK